MIRKILLSEWIRLRKLWIAYAGWAINWGILGWRLWTDHSSMVAHMTTANADQLAAFWSSTTLLPYVFTFAGQASFLNLLVWGMVGALWIETDWTAGMPAEHVVRSSLRNWVLARGGSFTCYILVMVLGEVAMAYGIGLGLGVGIDLSSWGLAGRLMVQMLTGPWLVGLFVMGLTALWRSAIGGTVSFFALWWVHQYIESTITSFLILHLGQLGRTLSWLIAAVDPLNVRMTVMDPSTWDWGGTLKSQGAYTTQGFFPLNAPDMFAFRGTWLGTLTRLSPSGEVHSQMVVYAPPIGVVSAMTAAEFVLLAWLSARSYRGAAQQGAEGKERRMQRSAAH